MVMHWRREGGPRSKLYMVINLFAFATFLLLLHPLQGGSEQVRHEEASTISKRRSPKQDPAQPADLTACRRVVRIASFSDRKMWGDDVGNGEAACNQNSRDAEGPGLVPGRLTSHGAAERREATVVPCRQLLSSGATMNECHSAAGT